MNKEKIPVAVLGATGSVGQKFISLLSNHPWFRVEMVAASDKSAGKKYSDAVNWILTDPLPEIIGNLKVKNCEPDKNICLAFSGLDSSVAGGIEEDFANAGYTVVSNSRNHRMDEFVPLIVPEVNSDHLQLVKKQQYKKGGCIVTNPNCSVIGLVLALKPLLDKFGIESVNVVTMQAISGAGYPGVAGLDIIDNVIPYIGGNEEWKVENEPNKIFGIITKSGVKNLDLKINAQCNRVPVVDGHTECVQVKLKKKTTVEEIVKTWDSFSGGITEYKLPLAPCKPIYYFPETNYPQPKIHRNIDKGMAVSIGRLREDKFFDFKFVILSHNTVRGAAGGALLCAELMKVKGYL